MNRDELTAAFSKSDLLGQELLRLGFDPIELEKCVLSCGCALCGVSIRTLTSFVEKNEVNQESLDLEHIRRCQCLFCVAMRLALASRGGEIFGSDVPENLRNGLSRAKGYFGSVRRLS